MALPVPAWAQENLDKFQEAMSGAEAPLPARARDFGPIDSFSTMFAEYTLRETDLLAHVFPRAGKEDHWSHGRYINRCRNCRVELVIQPGKGSQTPCPRCGKTGLAYIPGRLEEKAKVEFPKDMADKIKQAADAVWMGNVAIDYVVELGAYAVQFQDCATTAQVVGPDKFMDKFCEALDDLLEE